MNFSLEQPIKAAMFGKVTQKKGYWHNGRSLSYNYLLIYCIKGSFKMRFDGGMYEVNTGDILIVPPQVFYEPLHSDGCAYYFFHFSATSARASKDGLVVTKDERLPVGEYAYSYFSQSEESIEIDYLTKHSSAQSVNALFERAAKLDPSRRAKEKLLLDAILKELLVTISKDFSSPDSLHPTLRKIVEYIDGHYTEKICVSVLSAHFNRSPSYIARLFQQELHLRPSDYINKVRAANACALLLHTDLPVEEIAYRVGYSSPYYFSRVFKKLCGSSPQSYRKKYPLV